MEGGEWKVEVEVGCPPWASVHKANINLYGLSILGVNIKYRLSCTSLPPYGGYTGERLKHLHKSHVLTRSFMPLYFFWAILL